MPNTKSDAGACAVTDSRTDMASPLWNTCAGLPAWSRSATSVISISREPQRPSVASNMLRGVASAAESAAWAPPEPASPAAGGGADGGYGTDAVRLLADSTAFAVVDASNCSSPCSTAVRYASTTRLGSPLPRARPWSIQTASSQKRSTRLSECVTSRIVLFRRLNSANLSRHLWVNPSSPTASTSSTSSTSGSTWIATAKPSRMYMPDE